MRYVINHTVLGDRCSLCNEAATWDLESHGAHIYKCTHHMLQHVQALIRYHNLERTVMERKFNEHGFAVSDLELAMRKLGEEKK